jgi:hypothetical protein
MALSLACRSRSSSINDSYSSIYVVSVLSTLAAKYRGTKCLKILMPVSLFPNSHLKEPNPTIIVLSDFQWGSDGMMSDSTGTVVSLHFASNFLA